MQGTRARGCTIDGTSLWENKCRWQAGPASSPSEAEECSNLLERIAEIDDPGLRSARYDDPRIAALESSIRATVRDIFREGVPRAGEYGGFPLRTAAHGPHVEII